MEQFKAFRIHSAGGDSRLERIGLEDLSAGEVVVDVAYSSVNYKDALAASGGARIAQRFPIVGGIDLAGKVSSSEDPRFKPGDRVLCTGCGLSETLDGGFAEFARLPADILMPLPQGLSMFEAMALGTAGFTAALSLYRLQQNGQRPELGPVAVTGATGGVGSIAINLLAHLGYEVVAISGKMAQTDYLHALGATEVRNRRNLIIDDAPLAKGLWGGALDAVGGALLSWLLRSTRPWGNVASYGMAGGTGLNVSVYPFILRGVGLLGVSSANCPMELRRGIWTRLADAWKPPALERIAHRVIELAALPQVFAEMLAGKSLGRTVVRIHGT